MSYNIEEILIGPRKADDEKNYQKDEKRNSYLCDRLRGMIDTVEHIRAKNMETRGVLNCIRKELENVKEE